MALVKLSMDLYSYLDKRKQEKKDAKPVDAVKVPRNNSLNEYVWNYLLDNNGTDYNAYQAMYRHTYLPKPHPFEEDANKGAIAIYEAQRRFMQYKSPLYMPNINVRHLDLTSAYATVLSSVSSSLTFFMRYKYKSIEGIFNSMNNDLFYIIDIKMWLRYDSKINLYAPNTKILYNNKPISGNNIPPTGAPVYVSAKLLYCKKLNIYGFKYFSDDIFNQLLDIYDYQITINSYHVKKRTNMFEYDKLNQLLKEVKEEVDRQRRTDIKIALVTMTGILLNIDPGMRLIMLGRCEEIIHQFRNKLEEIGSKVQGVQVDAIYYVGQDLSNRFMLGVINKVTGINVFDYQPDDFVKVETYTKDDYKETNFRLQEVNNG